MCIAADKSKEHVAPPVAMTGKKVAPKSTKKKALQKVTKSPTKKMSTRKYYKVCANCSS